MSDTNSWNYYGNTGGLAVKSKYSSNTGNNIFDGLRDDAVRSGQFDAYSAYTVAVDGGQTSPNYANLEVVYKDSYGAVYESAGETFTFEQIHGDWSAWYTATFPPA